MGLNHPNHTRSGEAQRGCLGDGGKPSAVVYSNNDRESFSVDFYCRGRICSV